MSPAVTHQVPPISYTRKEKNRVTSQSPREHRPQHPERRAKTNTGVVGAPLPGGARASLTLALRGAPGSGFRAPAPGSGLRASGAAGSSCSGAHGRGVAMGRGRGTTAPPAPTIANGAKSELNTPRLGTGIGGCPVGAAARGGGAPGGAPQAVLHAAPRYLHKCCRGVTCVHVILHAALCMLRSVSVQCIAVLLAVSPALAIVLPALLLVVLLALVFCRAGCVAGCVSGCVSRCFAGAVLLALCCAVSLCRRCCWLCTAVLLLLTACLTHRRVTACVPQQPRPPAAGKTLLQSFKYSIAANLGWCSVHARRASSISRRFETHEHHPACRRC